MSSYTILGTGSSARLLRISPANHTTAVTTAPAAVLQVVEPRLDWLATGALARLTGFAHQLAGQPIELRRLLLAHFDGTARGTTTAALPADEGLRDVADWVSQIAAAAVGVPAANRAALRSEVARLLEGLDGVLVPAVLSSVAWGSTAVELVVSPVLSSWDDRHWRELFANLEEPFDDSSLGQAYTFCLFELDLYDQTGPAGAMSTVIDEVSRSGDVCQVLAPASIVRAWLQHHRPELAFELLTD